MGQTLQCLYDKIGDTMKYELSKAVYCCCGKYYALTESVKDKKCKCQNCGKELKPKLKVPYIYIVKNS